MEKFKGAYVIENGNKYLLYNIYTGAMSCVYKIGDKKLSECLTDEDLDSLYDNFVLFRDEFDYNSISRFIINKSKMANGKLVITDAPSYQCNLGCVYCMQQNTFKNVKQLDYKERVLIWKKLQDLTKCQYTRVVLFGGEPFFNTSFVKKMIDYAKEIGVTVHEYSAVTNGTYLSNELIQLIKTNNFTKFQITIDGPDYIHNARRVIKNKNNTGSWELIVENIRKLLIETNIEIIINTVLDANNRFHYIELVDKIRDLFSEYVYGSDARIVFNVGMECHPVDKCEYTNDAILKTDDYNDLIYSCMNYLCDNNLRINQPLPSPICIFSKENDIIISPDGNYTNVLVD